MRKKLDYVKRNRVITLIFLDAILIQAAVVLSYLLRFEFRMNDLMESGFLQGYLKVAPYYTVLTLLLFWVCRLYQSLWEYASIDELRYVILAVAGAALLETLLCLGMGIPQSRSLPFLNFGLLLMMVAGLRYSYRMVRRMRRRPLDNRIRTMVVGAGSAGAMVLRELNDSDSSSNRVVCLVDDAPKKLGTYLFGVPVAGNREAIPELAETFGVEEIIIAIPTATAAEKREIIGICQKTSCHLLTLPGLYQLANGQVDIKQIRDVRVEDLLGRDRVDVNIDEIGGYLRDKVVLVTGGGGSIGSELCRQIAGQAPRQLIIFDIYENNAYAIQQELRHLHPELDLVVLIGSVQDRERVEMIFSTYHPQLIYHAAAHKHVPLMEDSPNEAIKNNVFGTLNVSQLANKYKAERFVLISTDKAVNPTNVMGASKRVCEMIIEVMSQRSQTRFTAVRFGNVLGSNGSVIPLFKTQIEHGGPVTVTHKDIIRYFMTISEAVSLVLQAGYYARGGEVFVLDMGEPVRIDDLARNMIRLSGFEPDVDIKIEYTGLRPGEKLFEELLMQDEGLDRTPNDLIFIGHFHDFDRERLVESLQKLWTACRKNSPEIRSILQELVKTYYPREENPEEESRQAAAAEPEEAAAVETAGIVWQPKQMVKAPV